MSSKLLWGIIFILFLSCMVTESRRIEMSAEMRRIERRVVEQCGEKADIHKQWAEEFSYRLRYLETEHTHYYNSKPKQLGTDSYENN